MLATPRLLHYSPLPVIEWPQFLTPVVARNCGFLSAIILGQPGSGKTSVCREIVRGLGTEYVTVISGSPGQWNASDFPGQVVNIIEDAGFPLPDDDALVTMTRKDLIDIATKDDAESPIAGWIVDRQLDSFKLAKEKQSPPTTILVLDDMSETLKEKKNITLLRKLLKNLRHVQVHVLIVLHQTTDLPASVVPLVRFSIITGTEVNDTTKRDLKKFTSNLLTAAQISRLVPRLMDDKAMIVTKSGYNPRDDTLKITGRPTTLDEAGIRWFETACSLIVVKSFLKL